MLAKARAFWITHSRASSLLRGQTRNAPVQYTGNVSTFNWSSGTQEFQEGFNIASFSVSQAAIDFSQDVSVDPVGSLTLSASLDKGTRVDVAAKFTMILDVDQSTARDCPPSIIDEAVSQLGAVTDGCSIENSTIQDGDVRARNVAGFSIKNSVVRNDDIAIENASGAIRVERTKVTNGNIKVSDSSAPEILRNVVHGRVEIRENFHPRVTADQ